MITTSVLDIAFGDLFLDLKLDPTVTTLLKLEGFCIGGSIKLKTGRSMIEHLERAGRLVPGRSVVIESSSGNLGVALAIVCKLGGYGFVCVSDPNLPALSRGTIEAYGGRVIIADRPDENGGYLSERLNLIRQLMEKNPHYVWPDQYSNLANPEVHERVTAAEILRSVPDVSHVYVGTGSTGTATGLSRAFKGQRRPIEVIAVEPVGSVTFGGDPAPRYIPGIGTSHPPALADAASVDRIVFVDERTTVATCRAIVDRFGLLPGGSTGSVVAAIQADLPGFHSGGVVVGISADNGDKYVSTIYDDAWVASRYPTIPPMGGLQVKGPEEE